MIHRLIFITLLFASFSSFAQRDMNLDQVSRTYADKGVPLLMDLLSIPNDAFYPEDIEQNVLWC